MVRNLYVYFEKRTILNGIEIHKVVSAIKKELGLKIDFLQINFVKEESIIKLNKDHLDHDYSTDIITLDFGVDVNCIDGEIFISVEDAALNAKKYTVPFKDELFRLIIHGILHLSGYDDTDSGKKKIMKNKEDLLLTRVKKNLEC